jgi:hypothetical protein
MVSCKAQENIKEQNALKLYEALDLYIEKYMSKDYTYLTIYQGNLMKKCDYENIFFAINEIKILDNVAEHDYRTFDYKDKIIIYDKNHREVEKIFKQYFQKSNQDISHLPKGNDHTYYSGGVLILYVNGRFLIDKEVMDFFNNHCTNP